MITPHGSRAFTVKGLEGIFECAEAADVPAGTNTLESIPVEIGMLYNITDLATVNMNSPFTYMWWLHKNETFCPITAEHNAQTAGFWKCDPIDLWLNPGDYIRVEVFACTEGDHIKASINGSKRSL
jgi:hypothetical protein